MRYLVVAATLALAVPSLANAATWIATCTDGKNIQYNQIVGNHGDLYMKTPAGTYQVANTAQMSISRTVICGRVTDGVPAGGPPITQICADRSAGVIFLKYHNPTLPPATPPVNAGVYCTASVSVH